jgi:hypothetical protein
MRIKTTKINWRNVAENFWGRGGTTSYKTNRKGAYYYSCSGHGGYLVQESALTPQELESLAQSGLVKRDKIPVIMGPDGLCYGVDYTYNARYWSGRKRRFFVPPGSTWVDVFFYAFEEDCEWAVLETCTSIRVVEGSSLSEEDRMAHALTTVTRLKEWRNQTAANA